MTEFIKLLGIIALIFGSAAYSLHGYELARTQLEHLTNLTYNTGPHLLTNQSADLRTATTEIQQAHAAALSAQNNHR